MILITLFEIYIENIEIDFDSNDEADIPLQSENTHTKEKTVNAKKINSESVEEQISGQMIPKGERKRDQAPIAIKNQDKIEKLQNTTVDAEELLTEEVSQR